jgi:hypothetical protein
MVRSWVRTHAVVAVLLALGGIALTAFGVYWFAPQRLVLDQRVDEGLPSALAGSSEPGQADAAEPDASAGRHTLASGSFRSLEHATSGRATLIELADGHRFLRLEDLHTSNGPDLRVYLTDQPLSDDWHVWDDGEIVDLGALKGNVGSSNYLIAAGVDLSRLETAVIWCRRFTVGFGVAPLDHAS